MTICQVYLNIHLTEQTIKTVGYIVVYYLVIENINIEVSRTVVASRNSMCWGYGSRCALRGWSDQIKLFDR